jgi:hypothetical protein
MRDVSELRIERQSGALPAWLRTDVARCHSLREKRRGEGL